MSGGRGRWVAAAAGALLIAAAAGLGLRLREPADVPAPRPPAERPELLLLTSLPLVFPEDFSLDAPASPALEALQGRYRVRPISLADRASLGGSKLLLMAQPNSQPAEVLIELDQWVRGGGRVLLLADPALEWPSERPLGDALRPPIAFADTGLLGHWGLRLDAPDKPGPVNLGGVLNPVIYVSPGRLVSTNPDCRLSRAAIIAECEIGKGRVAVVADADFLNTEAIGAYAVIGENQADNQLGELLALLEQLEP